MIGLQIKGVSFSYFNGLVLRDLTLTIRPGEIAGVLGPNGSGKSTLLRLAGGLLRCQRGEVRLNGSNLKDMSRKSIARHLAIVPQQFHISFAFTVEEIVTLGRIPFLRPFAEEVDSDWRLVNEAMELVGISHLRARRFNELSGGERQKAVLAMALAQEPKLLLLDEPTAHLDITHQVEILELVRRLNLERGLTVLAAIHDLNLASLYFNRLILLKEGRLLADGAPAEVLTEPIINEVFSAAVKVEPHPATGVPHIVIMPRHRDNGHQ